MAHQADLEVPCYRRWRPSCPREEAATPAPRPGHAESDGGPTRNRRLSGSIRGCVVTEDAAGLDRVAANELLFVRLAKRTLAVRDGVDMPFADFACECTTDGCDLRVEMTGAEYEPIRSSASRFVVAPRDEHVDLETESVVEWHQFYWVIERRLNAELADFFGSNRQRAGSGSHLSLVPAPEPVEAQPFTGLQLVAAPGREDRL